ncbi:DUF1127 domain-containing protein [Pseudomonas sp. O64]|uniref:DUF1127 domain-containing protein n=1 Tax=unclassified Pseudomonas TaxID=196821 RepID=UPI0021D8538C|nr:DUF1127 domain-containing protein [Pseudomonas sp. YeP6b]UXZ22980.1 DUF1127 domain-containing protein [Pseudomonas sp. YeP6b]
MNTQRSSFKQLLVRTANALARWARQAHERHQLAQLDPRELSDAGISQGDRIAELSKPFWRE